ncbi:Dabb family protein [Mycobacterium yunnanensis]|uniref:Dabb family protein n=1 Tax=Mycobacterium yunnanensis TaxID=368477 RepID=A0A9X3BTL6_9MYCO|nr:Dabb family protein [Mycobacterium yunnanensis]MCV7421789.1 Dabb family protein [Mycobacterium yunnanensis]
MIRHIVAFELDAPDDEARRAHIERMQNVLEALATLDEVESITVRPDLGTADGHWDVVLVSEHRSTAALEAYQVHPRHREAATIAGEFVARRAIVDYEY